MGRYDRYKQADDTTLEQWIKLQQSKLFIGKHVFDEKHMNVAFVYLDAVKPLVDAAMFDYFSDKIKHKSSFNGRVTIDLLWLTQRMQTLRTNAEAEIMFDALSQQIVEYNAPEWMERDHIAHMEWSISNGAINNVLKELMEHPSDNNDRAADVLSFHIQRIIKHWHIQKWVYSNGEK